jgi:hypothetical protein
MPAAPPWRRFPGKLRLEMSVDDDRVPVTGRNVCTLNARGSACSTRVDGFFKLISDRITGATIVD